MPAIFYSNPVVLIWMDVVLRKCYQDKNLFIEFHIVFRCKFESISVDIVYPPSPTECRLKTTNIGGGVIPEAKTTKQHKVLFIGNCEWVRDKRRFSCLRGKQPRKGKSLFAKFELDWVKALVESPNTCMLCVCYIRNQNSEPCHFSLCWAVFFFFLLWHRDNGGRANANEIKFLPWWPYDDGDGENSSSYLVILCQRDSSNNKRTKIELW